ncbi:WecB/TagA/CpsF family glycosyltransferase [Mycobacterium sp. Aquia_213]|uniref:WecB/TagA/CpsF family glycosyltransferase n=1 Tax=Mycobacterium sp. Aquia_213 TaxID=2991728 RepID=UPI0022706ADD|nr:WecB/TagA/CpsF family glycosyltransferase [Mycobacterium sp. Aquia_213]WAC92650.1 WecB/TagA/CpsF family glycosyltransferase [Mycobacterium sp. Aquia_213]
MQAFSSAPVTILDVIRLEDTAGQYGETLTLPQFAAVTPLAPAKVAPTTHDREVTTEIINSITLVHDHDDADDLIRECLASPTSRIISFVNAHAFNLCNRHPEFADALLRSDVILRDGIGMQLLFQALNIDAGLNMNGTDFIPRLLDSAKGQTVGILGTADPYLSTAVDQLTQAGHNVIVSKDGFQDEATYLALVEQHRPRIIVLGMGMPKQELVAAYLKDNVTYNPLIINAGALIDFIGGKAKRAPMWMRRAHLEWAFRLLNEPTRLFHRYVTGNVVFLSRINRIRNTYVPAFDEPLELGLNDIAV